MQKKTILTIAGSDSCSGAGIQADLKTCFSLGVYACTAITAVTAQNTQGVNHVYLLPTNTIEQQITAILDGMQIDAIKIGMLGSAAIISTIANIIVKYNLKIPLVLDPVMVATSGDNLIEPQALATLKTELIPLSSLITPNIPEAQMLVASKDDCVDIQQMQSLIEPLKQLGADAVLLKGGHLINGQYKTDLLARKNDNRIYKFSGNNINIGEIHGSGCTLAAAITALLAKGNDLLDAISGAKDYLTRALSYSAKASYGHTSTIINHAYTLDFETN